MGSHDVDGWRIRRLRTTPRRRGLEDVLFDRRLRALDTTELTEQLEQLETELAELQARLQASEERAPGHVLFLPAADGYAIVEADEPPPPADQLLLLDRGCFRVQRIGRSPFPADRRPCLYLAPA